MTQAVCETNQNYRKLFLLQHASTRRFVLLEIHHRAKSHEGDEGNEEGQEGRGSTSAKSYEIHEDRQGSEEGQEGHGSTSAKRYKSYEVSYEVKCLVQEMTEVAVEANEGR